MPQKKTGKERERELLRFLESSLRSHRHFPSYREIATALDWKSTNTVARYVRRLVDAGLLEKEPGRVRSFRLKRYRRSRYLKGQVAEAEVMQAGREGEKVSPTMWIDRSWVRGENLQVWELTGRGPFTWGVEHGDQVVVERGVELLAGDLALSVAGRDVLVGRVYQDGSATHLLVSEEPEEILILGEGSLAGDVIGRIVALLRRY